MTTSKEEKEWNDAWTGFGNTEYFKCDGINCSAQSILDEISPITENIGIVVNAVDEIMHSSVLGRKSFIETVSSWVHKGFLEQLVNGLLALGFGVWVTSDHGNIEATGIGKISDGVLADVKGKRARIYSSKTLRDVATKRWEHAQRWDSSILPDAFFAILAKDNYSFSEQGVNIITHGGISIDEVMVPFIKIGKADE